MRANKELNRACSYLSYTATAQPAPQRQGAHNWEGNGHLTAVDALAALGVASRLRVPSNYPALAAATAACCFARTVLFARSQNTSLEKHKPWNSAH